MSDDKSVNPDTEGYEDNYSESAFFAWLRRMFIRAGWQLVYHAFVLYYCMVDGNTPVHVKATIMGALGYLISPIDLIPDIFPAIGLADDAAVLLATLHMIQSNITEAHRRRARERTNRLFGIQDEK